MLHVVAVEVRRFYKVYVEDDGKELTESEVENLARKMIAENGDDAMTEDIEMEFEPDDVLNLRYDYPVYD